MSVCATFPHPLSAALCCLFIRCFAHCSTLSTLATADAFLLNKLQTQLTFHAIFSLPRLCAPLCPSLTHFFAAFPQLMLYPSQTHSPVTRLLQFSPLAFAFLQPLRGFFIFLPLPDAFFNYVCIFLISPPAPRSAFFSGCSFLICTLKFSILSA